MSGSLLKEVNILSSGHKFLLKPFIHLNSKERMDRRHKSEDNKNCRKAFALCKMYGHLIFHSIHSCKSELLHTEIVVELLFGEMNSISR